MSHLYLTSQDGIEFALNVIQFRSPMSSSIQSVQTRTMQQHFPIRAGQPDIQFSCIFASNDEKHRFQNFVREHQTKALGVTDLLPMDVNLFWPERNIENWTGYITTFKVVERRFEYAPVVTFGVDLIDSLMSEKTTISSTGSPFDRVLGPQIAKWVPDFSAALFGLPSRVFRSPAQGGIGA